MGHSSFLFVTLAMSVCSFGSVLQTSYSLDISGSVEPPQSTGRNINGLDGAASEVIFYSDSSVEGSGHSADSVASPQLSNETVISEDPQRVSNANSGPGMTFTSRAVLPVHHSEAHKQEADKADASITGYSQSTSASQEALLESSHITAEKHLKDSHASTLKYDTLTGGDRAELPVQTSVFTFMTNHNLAGPEDPCMLGTTHCTVFTNFNGTTLLWDDMRRTLAFAWELHVFGSASLFSLMAALAVLGMAGAWTLPHPLCDALTLSNTLLIMAGVLRTVLLLLDPYGTRQILPHATLAALHNIPLHLLLWSQVVLTLVTLRGLKLLLFPSKLQRPWVVGWVGMSHCTALLVTDLYASTLSPALPLLLHTLSLLWGIPFCMEVLTKSLSNLHPFLSSSVPQWVASQRTERLGRRVIAVCAFLGVLCCSLQVYSLLWLYGLLGNWRLFGWGWWLSQFWARILEVAWGFSLLFLGSWIFWTPSISHVRGDHGQGKGEESNRVEEKNLWCKVMDTMQKGSLIKSEKSWEELIPNNWTKYKLSRAGISNNAMSLHDNEPAAMKPEYNPDPVSSSSSDSQAALLWQKVSERECVLSLIEFDMRPPSPINLRRSIDNALYHGQLVAGGLFTPPPPSWTQTMNIDGDSSPIIFPPAYVSYGWMPDTESISASLDHFQANESAQSVSATPDCNGSTGSPAAAQEGEDSSAVMCQHDWSDDDITDL
ncbi:proline-rich transmembrane protein 3-like [Melanotaenia boesemani]|uniref:proline-rich transmembrane protein 3-like n=1 Tax=Melanotaenia boesemani TaxID=1250792 RepID=UPI001C05186B|nr:proline-rich transmembrane protein 3-like [Melanotaenia boesemani]XP_041837019.1 proline-rich transmembrane protein 3-like [Melanotaenia boesemani]